MESFKEAKIESEVPQNLEYICHNPLTFVPRHA